MNKALSLLILLVSFVPQLHADDRDVRGSKDHDLISRYHNSVIVGYKYYDYEDFRLPLSALKRDRQGIVIDDFLDLEGRLTVITYEIKDKTSTLKVLHNFEKPLKSAGFEEMFKCTGSECGLQDIWDEALEQVHLNNGKQQTIRYLAAKKSGGQEGIYVGIYVMETYTGKLFVGVNLLETDDMETGLVTVDTGMLERQLSENGKVALYGINFDRDKAALKQKSFAILEQIHQLLTKKKDLKLYIVGHTDDTGNLAHNLDLSKRRAEAVVASLVKTYGISTDRLISFGAGPYTPVASNRSKEGRARNRRVELVQRLD